MASNYNSSAIKSKQVDNTKINSKMASIYINANSMQNKCLAFIYIQLLTQKLSDGINSQAKTIARNVNCNFC